MKTTDLSIQLNNAIFNNKDISVFENDLNKLIIDLDIDSDSTKNQLISIYFWLFVCQNKDDCAQQDKERFFSKYNKFLSHIYDRRLNISKKLDKYQSQALIIDFPKKITEEFGRAIDGFKTIKQLSILEKEVKRVLFIEDHRLIFSALVEDELIDKSIVNELFRLSGIYKDSDDINRKEAYYSFKEKIKDYIETAKRDRSFFSLNLLLPFAEKLLQTIKVDFAKTFEGDPAEITIIGTEKKYPFYKRERDINVEIQIGNSKDGIAYGFQLVITKHSDTIKIPKNEFFIGNVEKGKVTIELKIFNEFTSQGINVQGECIWNDLDDTKRNCRFDIDFLCQKSNVDWTALSRNRPYNLEPISSAEKLIGRMDILNRLSANIQSNNIESYIIHGQKRTGKTSIVKTFETIINNLKSNNLKVSYIVSPRKPAMIYKSAI